MDDDLPGHPLEPKVENCFGGRNGPLPMDISKKIGSLVHEDNAEACKYKTNNQLDLGLNKQNGSQMMKVEIKQIEYKIQHSENTEIQESIFKFEIEDAIRSNNVGSAGSNTGGVNTVNDICKMNRNSGHIQDFIKATIGKGLDAASPFFTIKELKRFLNLRMIGFSDMPRRPLKIGEASFSEVFRVDGKIYKIIPFNQWYGIESFCKEVFVLEALKSQKGICRIVDKFTIKGRFSGEYIKSWEYYKKHNESENLHPTGYKSSQVFGVVVMEDCGTPFESYQFRDFQEIQGFISQLLTTIATLEKYYRFEHRDLHWGNILIKDSEIFLIDFNFARMEAGIDKEKGEIVNVLCNIYDGGDGDSNDRMICGTENAKRSGIIKILFTDLKKEEWMFEGDSSVDLQFEVYKSMKRACRDEWVHFSEKSNLLWVIYLLDKLFLKIRDLEISSDRFKCAKLVQELIVEAKKCSNTKELLEFYKITLISGGRA